MKKSPSYLKFSFQAYDEVDGTDESGRGELPNPMALNVSKDVPLAVGPPLALKSVRHNRCALE